MGLLLSFFYIGIDAVLLSLGDHRPQLDTALQAIAHLQALGHRLHAIHELVVHFARNEHPAAGDAHLAGIEERRPVDRALDRAIEVGILEDDVG